MNIKSFLAIFDKAELNENEKHYFLEDAKEAVANIVNCNNAYEYYKLNETQYCLIHYAKDSFKSIAKEGLNKILGVL